MNKKNVILVISTILGIGILVFGLLYVINHTDIWQRGELGDDPAATEALESQKETMENGEPQVTVTTPPATSSERGDDESRDVPHPPVLKTDIPDHLLLYAESPPSLEGFAYEPSEKIGEPGVDFEPLLKGVDDDWEDIPIPLINPLGSKEYYYRVSYRAASSNFVLMSYLEGFREHSHRVYGQSWELRIRDDSLSMNFIRWYARELGATIYDNTDDRITFSLEENGQLWWASATWSSPDSNDTTMRVVKQDLLPIGQTLVITPDDTDDGYYSFTTIAQSGDFLTAIVTIHGDPDRAQATITASQSITCGLLTRRFEYRKSIYLAHMDQYSLNDIPQTDQPLYWRIHFSSGTREPEKVSIRFEKSGSIEPIVVSDQMGRLKVEGTLGATTLTHQSAIYDIAHAEGYSTRGIRDHDGNYIFYLPAGYYNIHTVLPGRNVGGIRMIPVSGGEQTRIILPEEFKSMVSDMESMAGDFDTNEGSISILSNEDFDKTAQVSILVNDPLQRDIFPTKEHITIREGGEIAKILEITREIAPVNLVLVFDTSGSMQPYMRTAVEASKRFVDGLPEDTSIRLVSFHRAVTVHPGEGKETVKRAIDSLVAAGSTALYDATSIALELVHDMENAYIVIFSDGADSREPGVLGTGSDLTQAQIIQQIGETDVTVLTIGFSEEHDPDALIAMSLANDKGDYFSAMDEEMLDNAFAAVSAKFGNRFIIDYERPDMTVDMRSQEPVINIVIDDSGSMGHFRESVITLFYDFFHGLPDGTLIQLGKFADILDLMQITTDEKALILQAIGERGQTGGSGTNVLDALATSLGQISPLPTDKRVLIFLCDEALGEITGRWNLPRTEILLEEFRKEGIRCLFIGVAGASHVESAYQIAAELTGGEYLITDDLEEIEHALQTLLNQVSVPFLEGSFVPFSIGIRAPTEDGSIMDYFATKNLTNFALKVTQGEAIEPRTVKIVTGEFMTPLFDQETSKVLTGGTQAHDDAVVLTNRITYEAPEPIQDTPASSTPTDTVSYGKTANNQMLEITVKEAYTFDVLAGVAAHRNNQFIALSIDLHFPVQDTHITAYQIPSIMQHFYLSINNQNPTPASEATWLAEKPLSPPGQPRITVGQGERQSGVLVFYTQKPETITQLGLHFYDTVHGHIHIPLTGRIRDHMKEIESLPKTAPANISDAFTMTVTGVCDEEHYGSYQPITDKEPNDPFTLQNKMLRTVEAVFDSQVQALLNLDPMKRFFYAVQTDHGSLMTRMNRMVHNIPLGFTGQTLIAPGASNTVYLPYEIPTAFAQAQSFIYGDVKDSDVRLPVTQGDPIHTYSKEIRVSHEYFDLIIHDLAYSPFRGRTIVLDVTVEDKKDGFSTSGLHNAFALANDSETNERYAFIGSHDGDLLYGIDSDWVVFDGQARRGILLFDVRDNLEQYVLTSIHFPDLALPIENRPYHHPELLAQRYEVSVDTSFQQSLDQAVSASITAYRAHRARIDESIQTIAFSSEDPAGTMVHAPESSVFGQRVLQTIESKQDLLHVMYAMRWLPAGGRKLYYYAPKAVLTQGWGTQWDLIMLADHMFAELGIKTTYRDVEITRLGQQALAAISGIDDMRTLRTLPALAYIDDKGNHRMFVIPFMRDLSELAGLVYLPQTQSGKKPDPATVTLSITAIAEGDPDRIGLGQADLFNAFSSMAVPSESAPETRIEKEVLLLSETLRIPALSLGPIDIGYFVAVKSSTGGDIIKAVAETTDGRIQGIDGIDTSLDDLLGIRVELTFTGSPRDGYVHTTWIEKGQNITDICHTLAFALPELSEKSIEILEKESMEATKQADDQTNNASIVKWFNRSTLYRYIAARTEYDRYMERMLGIVLGRTHLPMAVMITTRSDGVNALASVDLIHHHNQILQGKSEQTNAYRLLSGMYASILEGEAIPDHTGINMLDLWQQASSQTGFLYIEDTVEAREEALRMLSDDYPPRLLEHIQQALDTRNHVVFIIPKSPGLFQGEFRWAWLEIDSTTYDAISVFDTGERAGMAGYAMGLMSNKAVQGYVGFFIGVNCATWSISAYSLAMDDPQDIKDAAAMLCADILQQLKELLGVTGSKGAADYFGGKVKDNVSIKGVSISDMEGLLSPKPKTPGFVEGFEAALSIYFD